MRLYGCHVRARGAKEWIRVLFATEPELDRAVRDFQAQGFEVA